MNCGLVGPITALAEDVERLGQVRLGVGEVTGVDQSAAQLVAGDPALTAPQRSSCGFPVVSYVW